MKKKYDAAVKVGSYMKDGQEKSRYENVGAIMEGDNGPFMFLKRSFNPSGVPFREGSESIIISLFEPKERGAAQPAKPQAAQGNDFDDDIPF